MSLSGERIDLASTPDFEVGGLLVSPSACRVTSNGVENRIEPKVMEVLIVLVRATGRTVTRDELIEACWDGRAVSDDAVSRVIAKVRQLGRGVEPPHFTLETLPKVGFRMEVAAAAAPAVSRADEDAPAAGLLPPAQQATLLHLIAPHWRIAGIGMALALLLLATAWFAPWRTPAAGESHVVVSAFRTLHSSPELDRLSANASNAMFRTLTQSSVQAEMTQEGSKATSARGNGFEVLGMVDRDGDTYRITTSVSDRSSGRLLWSNVIERDVSDLQGIDGEAAHDTTHVLRCALRERTAASQPASLDVFALLLSACSGSLTLENAEKSVATTRQLVEQAPELAASHAFRAMALEWRAGQIDHLSEEARGLRKEALAAAKRALDLDPKSFSGHLAMDEVLGSTTEFAAREYHLRRALAISPDDPAAAGLFGKFLRDVGRTGAAREMFRRVETRAGPLMQGIILSAMQGDAEETKRLQGILAGVRLSWSRGSHAMIKVFWEDPATVLATLEQQPAAMRLPKPLCLRPYLQALVAPTRGAAVDLHPDCNDLAFDWRVRMLARLGEIDAAYAMLDQPMPNSRQNTVFLYYPEMKAFRHDKRFMPLAARLGLVAYWRQSGKWPDFCAEPDLPYDCRTWQSK
jgi:DNA-binding winged helix-turn-helix (wHTH) protein/TolB-like protein/tetratricopeptide (TPR) repeat protein